jgi:hypothetical protein
LRYGFAKRALWPVENSRLNANTGRRQVFHAAKRYLQSGGGQCLLLIYKVTGTRSRYQFP